MLKNKESEIQAIVAVDRNGKILPPCGRCRELLQQVNLKNLQTEVFVSKNKAIKLKELLPCRYKYESK
jgi:cytidine deaminase